MSTIKAPPRLADILADPPTPRVYSYTRFSTPEQAKGDSFRRQTEAAARWAQRKGLTLDESLTISDEGVSAYRGTNAMDGGLSRFLAACRRDLIEPGSYLLVESLDRISRMAPRKAQRLLDDIVDAGITIVTLSDEQEYTADRLDNDPTALLISLMVAWRAHEESKTKGRRVAAAWAEKRRKVAAGECRRLTNRGPSWLVPDGDWWREDKEKADTVRRIFALTLAGEGEHAIAKRLNKEAKGNRAAQGRHRGGWQCLKRRRLSRMLRQSRNPAMPSRRMTYRYNQRNPPHRGPLPIDLAWQASSTVTPTTSRRYGCSSSSLEEFGICAKGKQAIGRPGLAEEVRRAILRTRGEGKSVRETAKECRVSPVTVQKVLKEVA